MIEEGYVKFRAEWHEGPALQGHDDLVAARNQLFQLGLIGEYAEARIGFGNVSKKLPLAQGFLVSGTATGGIAEVGHQHFCIVEAYAIAENWVKCVGPVTASSESLTHAMLYACDAAIGAVLHIHHRAFWESLLHTVPTSLETVAYGTPAMALEMQRLMATTDLPTLKILAMGGHPEGIITTGRDVAEALAVLLDHYQRWGKENVEKKMGEVLLNQRAK